MKTRNNYPATQTGEGTFGCKVNGEVWRPEIPEISKSALKASYGKGRLSINADKEEYNSKNINQEINVYISKKINIGIKYDLLDKDHKIHAQSQDIIKGCYYLTDSINNGFIKITRLDSIENIVSGKFEFTAVDDTCNKKADTFHVTKGRFDIKYAY